MNTEITRKTFEECLDERRVAGHLRFKGRDRDGKGSSGEWHDISASRAKAGRQDDEPGLRKTEINDVLPNWAAPFAVHPQAKQTFRMPIQ